MLKGKKKKMVTLILDKLIQTHIQAQACALLTWKYDMGVERTSRPKVSET